MPSLIELDFKQHTEKTKRGKDISRWSSFEHTHFAQSVSFIMVSLSRNVDFAENNYRLRTRFHTRLTVIEKNAGIYSTLIFPVSLGMHLAKLTPS